MILLGLKCVTSIYPLRLYYGLCFCDVKDLTYKNIDYTNHLLKFEQNKTKGHSANSGVVIPLNDGLLSLIGEDPENLDSSIFNLPTYESCCKSVKRWVKRAGINKHISWHCLRHRDFYKHQIINRLYCLSIKGGNDKETSELLYSILFCHFKEPLCLMQR